jgi:tripartite-type tricarboxylate transporter receptor subunit TctC
MVANFLSRALYGMLGNGGRLTLDLPCMVAVLLSGFSFASLPTSPAAAQNAFPSREITLIVPFAAGGPTDIVARAVGARMSQLLRQQIVIENVVGSGGATAAIRTKRSSPDGYTIMLGHMGTHAAAVAFNPNLGYSPADDFEPIGLVASMPVLVLARKDFPASTLTEFINYARGSATNLTMAHAGTGSVSFATCELLNSLTGLKPRLIAFQGTGPAMNAIVAGRVDYMCDQAVNVVPQVQAEAVKAYVVGTSARISVLPEVPTSAEAGLPEFKVSAWNGFFAPKGTPEPIVQKIFSAISAALEDEGTLKQLAILGCNIPERESRTPGALAALVASDIARWSSIVASEGFGH